MHLLEFIENYSCDITGGDTFECPNNIIGELRYIDFTRGVSMLFHPPSLDIYQIEIMGEGDHVQHIWVDTEFEDDYYRWFGGIHGDSWAKNLRKNSIGQYDMEAILAGHFNEPV